MTIKDNDPLVSVSPSTGSITEGSGTARFTVSLSAATNHDVLVDQDARPAPLQHGDDVLSTDPVIVVPQDGEHAMFFVDLPSPGVSVVRTPAYSHTISHHHPIVAFSDVRVPAANLVGAEGDGMTFAYEWFRFERLMVAARCLGAADRLTAEMTAFAATRQVGGHPISDFGLVAGMLADSLTELFAARSLAYETARGIDRGADVKVAHAQCSMAKLYCSEMAGRAADRAVQVFGGRGYMRENVAERFYREVRVERIWEGTSEVQRAIIAGQMVKRGPASLA